MSSRYTALNFIGGCIANGWLTQSFQLQSTTLLVAQIFPAQSLYTHLHKRKKNLIKAINTKRGCGRNVFFVTFISIYIFPMFKVLFTRPAQQLASNVSAAQVGKRVALASAVGVFGYSTVQQCRKDVLFFTRNN